MEDVTVASSHLEMRRHLSTTLAFHSVGVDAQVFQRRRDSISDEFVVLRVTMSYHGGKRRICRHLLDECFQWKVSAATTRQFINPSAF